MQSKTLQPYFLLAILGGSFVLAYLILKPFLAPLLLAVIFAVVLQPFYKRLRATLGDRASLASIATVLIFAIVVLVPAGFVGSRLVLEAQQLYASISTQGAGATLGTVLDAAERAVSGIIPDAGARFEQIRADIDTYAAKALNWIVEHIGAAFSSALTILLDIFVFFVALYYLLRDGSALTRKIVELSPLSDRDDSVVLDRLGAAVNSVIKGQLAIALIQGTLTGVGLAIFGVPNAVLWGMVAAIAALIPSIGTALVLAPAVVYLALVGSTGSAIGLAIWGATAVGLIDNLLGPRLISTGLQLHPLLVILAVLGGIIVFGPIGIFLGPLTMSLLLVLLSIYGDVLRRAEQSVPPVLQ